MAEGYCCCPQKHNDEHCCWQQNNAYGQSAETPFLKGTFYGVLFIWGRVKKFFQQNEIFSIFLRLFKWTGWKSLSGSFCNNCEPAARPFVPQMRNFISLLTTRFLDYLLYKKCDFLWQKKIFECCIMIMPEIEGVNLTCGKYDRNNGDLKWAVYET